MFFGDIFMQIHAFDLDKTLLTSNSSYCFGKYLFCHRRINFFTMLYLVFLYTAHTLGFIRMRRLHELSFESLFKGRSKAYFQQEVAAFLDEQLDDLIYLPAFEEFRGAKAHGSYTIIISSSPDFLVDQIAKRLGFSHSAATTYQNDVAGNFSSLGQVMDGNVKAAALTELANGLHVTRENIYAYSDSHLDVPFMEASGNPVAVRPDKQLRQISLQKGWRILL